MPRILSQSGNVIAADFRQNTHINLQLKTQILYCDAAVCLVRITYLHDGKTAATQHFTVETTFS
jgi:hypothetical protein